MEFLSERWQNSKESAAQRTFKTQVNGTSRLIDSLIAN